jgi:hypothetical protein
MHQEEAEEEEEEGQAYRGGWQQTNVMGSACVTADTTRAARLLE